ncbi:cytochrome b pre-mRNA-processing protein 3 [Roseiarcus fermentans]|uniref:Cytochrome b pre-mRNA-processing protein 3 n=1 Tax=Roseiarcus fermentans TaxID=1473586 RepID=A0A366EV35_9HYPH|nr:ubiquinol-cytochrome C chaperone family protein [Roseiarcus fermentans]RBP06242.1 cytochrome b pre-mRNA-processing protein 3 [Roseiarcus fermentans]
MRSNKCKATADVRPSHEGALMIFARWRARRASLALIEELRGEIVAAARRPALYAALGAPDRVDGRFELLALHAGLALRRLMTLGGLGEPMAQDLVNALFMHLDDTLREQALSDVSVSKRLSAMKSAFYGRNAAYAEALDSGSRERLEAALSRNVYGAPAGDGHAAALADYVLALEAALARTPIEDFAAGRFRYPDGALAGD